MQYYIYFFIVIMFLGKRLLVGAQLGFLFINNKDTINPGLSNRALS